MNKEKMFLLLSLGVLLLMFIFILMGGGPASGEMLSTTEAAITTAASAPFPPSTATTMNITTTIATQTYLPIAQQIWNAMLDKGWSYDVCAGIMGNIMAECGGGTLDIKPILRGDNETSFGICQWHNERKDNMLSFNDKNYNTSDNLPPIEHQIDYLEYELSLYNIDILNNDKTYEEVAYIFCVEYERPANKYKKAEQRKKLAAIAYQSLCD